MRLAVAALVLFIHATLQAQELRVTDYLFKRPGGLSKILGKKMRTGECADTDGRQIEYERGYVCVARGVVVLFSCDLRHQANTPDEALSAVGLSTNVRPDHPGGAAYQWTKVFGNPMRVSGKFATRVIAVVGERSSVTMNMGAE